jgi:tetratricopeptide (TPR) repeat protein
MSDRSFLEQFDRSYAPTRRRPPSAALFVATLLAVALVAGAGWFAWDRLVRDDSKTAEEWLAEGLALHVDGELVKASEAYREVLLIEPANKFALYTIGVIQQAEGRPEDAERSYRLALAADPNFPEALFNLAIVRFDAGDNREAIDLYRQLLGVQPDNASAHLNLGFALREVGQDEEGDAEIERAIELDPTLAASGNEAANG